MSLCFHRISKDTRWVSLNNTEVYERCVSAITRIQSVKATWRWPPSSVPYFWSKRYRSAHSQSSTRFPELVLKPRREWVLLLLCGGECLQVRLSERPAALHHPRAGRTVTVMGQLHQARHEAVVRQLVLSIEGIWGKKRRRSDPWVLKAVINVFLASIDPAVPLGSMKRFSVF